MKDVLAKSTPETVSEADVAELKAAKDKLMESAQKLAEKVYAQAQAAAYKEQLKNQTQQIASLDSEIKAKEAEEEAARKAAEEAAKKAAQEASNSSGSGSDSSSSSNSNKTYAPAGEATGDNIAAYACQFVGNPYVFGGTSLTDGCDCSGFVYSV